MVAEDVIYLLLKQRNFCIFPFSFALKKSHSKKLIIVSCIIIVQVYDTIGGYDMWWNELLITAGILQWPLYGRSFPKYYNFGTLGVVLSHELTHAVDEIGKYFACTTRSIVCPEKQSDTAEIC